MEDLARVVRRAHGKIVELSIKQGDCDGVMKFFVILVIFPLAGFGMWD
jgi:hypothetical protein